MQSDRSTNSFKQINKSIKKDLKNLEKVADLSFISRDNIVLNQIKSPRKIALSLQTALPNKVDLTKELISEHESKKQTIIGTNKLKPLINQEKHHDLGINFKSSDSKPKPKEQILTHRHPPFIHDEYVSVDELRNKVYKGTLGVLPARQSGQIEELNFIMKGKPLKKIEKPIFETESADASDDEQDVAAQSQEEQEQDDEEQDGDDEEEEEESDIYDKIHANLNTPVTAAIGEALLMANQTPYTIYASNFDFELKDTNRSNTTRAIKTKPAILPSTGTSGHAKFYERPKPVKKDTTLNFNNRKKMHHQHEVGETPIEMFRKNASAAEIQQAELELQIKELVSDAKGIASSVKTPVVGSSKRARTSNNQVQEPSSIEKNVNKNETLLLSTVEGLISAIKSGQIIKEQEESNVRIKEILVGILEKESLDAFESVFDQDKRPYSEAKESEKIKLDEIRSMENYSELEKKLESSSNHTLPGFQRLDTPTASKSLREESVSIYLESAQQTQRSLTSAYDHEINAFLASLPSEVTCTDVLNGYAKKIKMFEKKSAQKEKKKIESKQELTAEEKYEKNMHLFCMLEHERRYSLLLPNELINVTRKFHTRNKFESNMLYSGKNSLSREASVSSLKKSLHTSRRDSLTIEEAAKRVFNSFPNIIQFQSTPRKMEELRSMNDSGFADASLESWRLQAENYLSENFCLEAHKMEVKNSENLYDPSLRYLRPAPPKMSVKPNEIRKRLFAEYKSLPPPVWNENKKETKSTIRKKNPLKSKKFAYSDLDSDETDETEDSYSTESETESMIIFKKIINRQYNSDSDLIKLFKEEKKKNFNGFEMIIKRTLSDTLINETVKENGLEKSDGFLKIDSNYVDALDEAFNQKKRIKNIYQRKKQQEELEKKTISESLSQKTKEKTHTSGSQVTKEDSSHFPKAVHRDLLKEAADDKRNYIVKEKENKSKKSPKKVTKKLSQNFLTKIYKEIVENNKKKLQRSESINKIKFPVRVNHPDDLIIRLPRSFLEQKRPSVPNIFNFEEYKENHEFEPELGDREWTRKIWNFWFDEVIPQLDGSGGRPPSVIEIEKKSNRETNISVMSRGNTNSVVKTHNQTFEQDDEDDSGEKKAVAKSPTPYDEYSAIDLFDGDTELKPSDLEAIKIFESEIKKLNNRIERKENPFDLTRRGTLYRKLGNLSLAINDLTKSILLEKNYVDAYWQRHLIYLTQNKKNEALQDLIYLLKINRTHAGAYISIADLYVERNEMTEAISNYSNAIKYDPHNYIAYFKRAKIYEIRGETRMAMDDYLSTTKLNPKFYDAWFCHGMNYYNNNNWHYAIVDFTELIANCPKNQSEARLYRGKCNLNLGEYQEALNDFSIALHLNPKDWQSYYHRGCLLRKLNTNHALQDLSVSLLLESGYDNMNAFLHRGIIYAELERFDEAVKDFESALELDREFAPAYCNLGIIFMNVNMNYWKAIKNFNNAIKSDPVYLRAYLCRAQAYRYIHDLKRAYIDYTKAIHLDPMNTQVYIYRGQVIYEMGNAKLASFCVQHAAFMNEGMNDKTKPSREANRSAIASRSQKAVTTITDETVSSTANQSVTQQAVVFSFLKNYVKAIAILENELRTKPYPEIFNLLGRVFMKAKRLKDAVGSFEQSIECILELSGLKDIKKSIQSYSKLNMSKQFQQYLIEALSLKGLCLLDLANYQEAYNSFDKVIEMQPNNANAFYSRGMTRYHLNHPKCIQDFNKALSIDPKLFEAFLARACVYGLKNRFTKATLNCNEAVKICPKSVRAYLYRGALKYMSRSYEHAILDLTKAIDLDQTCAIAYLNRAQCFQQLKNYKSSLKDYSVVLLLGDYLKFKVYINRGLLYFSIENYSNALKDFIEASKFDLDDFKIQHMIGVCLHKLGRYHEAVEILSRTYDKNPKFYDALISRGNAYVDFGTQEAFFRAQRDYELVLLKDPKNMDAHINLAYLFQMTGKYMKSWNQFTEALKINSKFVPAYEGRSIVCLQMSNTDAALKDINEAMKFKRSAELHVNRGVIYQFMADNVNAMRDYQAAILVDSNYGLAYYNSANILLIHRQYSQAIQMLNLSIDKCNMKDESTYQNRAIAKAFLNDSSGAFRDLCEALKYDQYSAHIYMNRGLLLYKMENYKLAEKDLSTAIELSPDDSLYYKIRADCRGKLEKREEAIEDYKKFVDLSDRNEIIKRNRIK